MLDRLNEAGRAVEADGFLPTENAPQKLVEAHEMIHVPVADEHVADTKELPGR